MTLTIVILALVTFQRLGEMVLAQRNTRLLLARGAKEYGAGHYRYIVAMHATWLAALWWLAPGRPVSLPLLGLFALLQIGRIWVLATLRDRWTTRIIVLPGEPLVARGPYRFVPHPNYLVVIGEIAVLPLVWGFWDLALIFSLLNAAILSVRIREENHALGI